MNVILVLIDSLNRNCLGAYGDEKINTPNLDAFADKSLVFNRHFINSAPCMPARRNIMTGRQEFLWRPWGPIEPFDRPIANEGKNTGALTALITDHYHYWENPAHGYIEHFDCLEMIRGHERDSWNVEKVEDLPEWAQAIERWRPGAGVKYYQNVKDLKEEKDFFGPKVMTAAADWLDKNHDHEKFFLMVESFDVHEPFHVPEPYRSMYTKHGDKDYNCWPPYQNGYCGHREDYWEQLSDEELEFIRGQYHGKVTMVDKWLGKLFEVMDRRNLWENTAVIVTSDHGHELGEKQRFGKEYPHYDLNSNIPLMVWHPEFKDLNQNKSIDTFTTTPDLYPTILEMLGAEQIESPHGRSLMPLISGQTNKHRDAVLYGTFGYGVTVTNKDYTYCCGPVMDGNLNSYTAMMLGPVPDAIGGKFIPNVDCPVWRIPISPELTYPNLPVRKVCPSNIGAGPCEDLLFDRNNDPQQNHNICDQQPDAKELMRETLISLMEEEGVPPEQFVRLGLK